MTQPTDAMLQVDGLSVVFGARSVLGGSTTPVTAVADVSFAIARGETVALVGESGSGKTTLGRAVVGLQKPTRGSIWYRGVDLARVSGRRLRELRKHIQLVYQDPFGSLDPRMRVDALLEESLIVHRVGSSAERRARVAELMNLVSIPSDFANRYPHELSGGQRQRVGIAQALAIAPELLICDEPVSALDVSVQAQVLNLLMDLRDRLGLTLLFISHDLAVVRLIANRIVVLYKGRIVESGPTEEVFLHPAHPYTAALLAAAPSFGARSLSGGSANDAGEDLATDPAIGCPYRSRCSLYQHLGRPESCRVQVPVLVAKQPGDHYAACHYDASMNSRNASSVDS